MVPCTPVTSWADVNAAKVELSSASEATLEKLSVPQ
jgi:hypothetical protein